MPTQSSEGLGRSNAPESNQTDESKVTEYDELLFRIFALPRNSRRQLIAVAGAPASGKSTLTVRLADSLSQAGRLARVVPLDGFHLDNRILDQLELRSRKGAPETFDAHGFVSLVNRIRNGGEIIYPIFDRSRDIAIAGAAALEPECDIVIFEGNYLLFDESPWRELKKFWDLSIWFDVPEPILLERCVQRWLEHGHTPEAALARAEGNDLANARRIFEARLSADITFFSGDDIG